MKLEDYEELLTELHERKLISIQQFIDLLKEEESIIEATNQRIEITKYGLLDSFSSS